MLNIRRFGGYFIGLNVRRLKRMTFVAVGYKDYCARKSLPMSFGLARKGENVQEFKENGYLKVELSPELKNELIRASERKIEEVGMDGTVPINGTTFFRDALNPSDYDPSSPFMKFALDESILNTVGQYLGMAPMINSIELIYSMPTGLKKGRAE